MAVTLAPGPRQCLILRRKLQLPARLIPINQLLQVVQLLQVHILLVRMR